MRCTGCSEDVCSVAGAYGTRSLSVFRGASVFLEPRVYLTLLNVMVHPKQTNIISVECIENVQFG